MGASRQDELLAMVRQAFSSGAPVGFDRRCSVVEVRERHGEAVVLVRWDEDAHLYGIPVPLNDARHEFYYSDFAVSSDEEWLDSVTLGLGVMLDTGFRATARRTQIDDYIELRADGGWPVDDRFYLQEVDERFELLADRLSEVGLDPALAVRRRSEYRLVVWLLVYENNATGGPWVGQAVVTRDAQHSAELELIQTSRNVPGTVRLDLAYFASHHAAAAGASTVTTTVPDDEFLIAGFVSATSGVRTLDTSFLDARPEDARALLEKDISIGSKWGGDRDEAGRYLPASRVGKLIHRLRWGRSGRRPRVYAG